VSSAFAAPASAGIPVTHRGLSASVLVTTGHDIERFAQTVASLDAASITLVVMMGTANRREIAESLIGAGWHRSLPAAIIRDATLPEQTVWTGTLDRLAAAPDAAAPGTIVVGEVVRIRERLAGLSPAVLETAQLSSGIH
jgi:siroheme synthase